MVSNQQKNDFQVASYFEVFMLDEWEVPLYVIILEREYCHLQAYLSSIQQHKIFTPYRFVVDLSQMTSSRLIQRL